MVGGDYVTGGIIAKTTDGGVNWVNVNPPNVTMMAAVCFSNATTGFVAGFGGAIMKTENGGTYLSDLLKNEHRLIVYPVPAGDHITLCLPESISLKNSSIIVCNMQGCTLLEQPALSHIMNINLSGLSSGVFIIRFKGCNEILTTKIIRQ